MAHEIHIDNGKASMMYVGEKPWHGLGTKLDKPATAEEAFKAANLDWQVVKQPLYAKVGDKTRLVPDKFMVVPENKWGTSDCPIFGIVGRGYTPLQDWDAFGFFDNIVGKGAAIYHTAGALGKGERIWILAKLPSYIKVIGDDITEKYLLLSNSHDGKASVQIKFTPVRVVCQNTLTMALRDGPTLRVSHTKDLHKRLKQAEHLLGVIHSHYDNIEKIFKKMAQVRMNDKRSAKYLGWYSRTPRTPGDEAGRERAKSQRLWSGVFGLEWAGKLYARCLRDPLGGLQRRDRINRSVQIPSVQTTGDRRLNSLWFGEGYQIKARAFRVARLESASVAKLKGKS